ncbi:MAG TPA: hypothetical protein EYH06_02515 [Chromatiales bacterium]|nr:hypothetical protein [Chromatiales bacterium]
MNLLVLARVFHLSGIIQRRLEIVRVLVSEKGAKWFTWGYRPPINYATGDYGA